MLCCLMQGLCFADTPFSPSHFCVRKSSVDVQSKTCCAHSGSRTRWTFSGVVPTGEPQDSRAAWAPRVMPWFRLLFVHQLSQSIIKLAGGRRRTDVQQVVKLGTKRTECRKGWSRVKEEVIKKRCYLKAAWFWAAMVKSSWEQLQEKYDCALRGINWMGQYFKQEKLRGKIRQNQL